MNWQPQFNPPPGFSFPEKGTVFTPDQQRTRAEFARIVFDGMGPICRERGYALARHGSGIRDIDLIAVPWEPEAAPATELVLELATILNLTMFAAFKMPHGVRWWGMVGHSFPSLPIELAVCPLMPATAETVSILETHDGR